MTNKLIELYISVDSNMEVDEEYIEELTRNLAADLNELDSLESIDRIEVKKAEEGAKGLSLSMGTLLIKIAEAGGISALISTLRLWLSRDRNRTLRLQLGDNSLEVSGLSDIEQKDLIKWFQTQAGLQLDS